MKVPAFVPGHVWKYSLTTFLTKLTKSNTFADSPMGRHELGKGASVFQQLKATNVPEL